MEHKTGIIVVTYNVPDFVLYQEKTLRKFFAGKYDLIIVDNSDVPEKAEAIKYHCDQLELAYVKTNATSSNSSDSHAFALNLAYNRFKSDYHFLMFLDHDCFLFKSFSVLLYLNYFVMAGLKQKKGGIEYFWPGCLMMDMTSLDPDIVDFSVNHEKGLDTGGNLYKLIDTIKESGGDVGELTETYEQNPTFNTPPYNFYSIIGGVFMHFINGSGWNKANDSNQERINSLFNILNTKIES